jgi:four helix bundle protein
MDERTKVLLDRTFFFGIGVLKFLKKLPYHSIYKIPVNQLARSSTSVGSNYEEAQGAFSKKDFHHKISICYKEARESVYWLRTLKELYSEECYEKDFDFFLSEGKQLLKIFGSIKKTSEK